MDWNFKWLSLLDLGAAVFLGEYAAAADGQCGAWCCRSDLGTQQVLLPIGMSGVNFILGVVLGSFDIARLDRLVYGAYLV